MRVLQLVDSWSSGPGEPFAGLPKCSRGEGQKKVSCAGLRRLVLGADDARGVAAFATLQLLPPPGSQYDDAHGCWSVSADEWGV